MNKACSDGGRALVLGCGGVAGAAWSIPMLDAVQRELSWDPRTAKVLIGTSVGAVLASLLAGGIGVAQLMACQRGDVGECIWDHEKDYGGALPPWPALRFPAFGLVLEGLRGRLGWTTAALGLLPRGRADMRPLVRLIDRVVPPGSWAPHPAAWMMAVDAATGKRVALGRDDAPAAPLNKAVCASYGVPAWCPPVKVGTRLYMDGGMASPTSADFLLNSGTSEAIVLAPMASREMDRPRSLVERLERSLRRRMTTILDREEAALRQAGISVLRLEPGPEDLAAFGGNMMDPRRRHRVFETSQRTSGATLRQALAANELTKGRGLS